MNQLREIAHLYNNKAEEWFSKYMRYKPTTRDIKKQGSQPFCRGTFHCPTLLACWAAAPQCRIVKLAVPVAQWSPSGTMASELESQMAQPGDLLRLPDSEPRALLRGEAGATAAAAEQ